MGLDSIVQISISRQTAGVTQAGFGVPLILGPNAPFANTEIRQYASIDAVDEDFETSDAERVMANKLFSQTPRPPFIKIGKTSMPVAQIETLTPDPKNQESYTVTINGVEFEFVSDMDATAEEIVAGLIALVNADTDLRVTASGSTTLILTADNAGEPFTIAASENLSIAHTTASNGIAEDIIQAINVDPDWYELLTTATDKTTVRMASETIESRKRIYNFLNSDSNVRTNATDDIFSELKAKGLMRTFGAYSGTSGDRMDAAWAGRVLPLDPGSETWAYKTLAGVTVDKWTDPQIAFLDDKNVNYYINIAGVNVTQNGKMVGGEYVDVVRFIDWLTARMQEAIFGDLSRLDKIPFTDAGFAIIENDMRAVLEAGVRAGGIGSSQDYSITMPKANTISQEDKAARRLTGIKFSAVLAGAIHAVQIQGNVTL